MKRLTLWLAPGLIMATGLLYLLNARLALALNQVCEMLATGNTRGLQMFFYSADSLGPLAAVGIGTVAFLVPILKPAYLLEANLQYFGPLAGIAMTAVSGFLALTVLILSGVSLWALFPTAFKGKLNAVPGLGYYLILGCIILLAARLG